VFVVMRIQHYVPPPPRTPDQIRVPRTQRVQIPDQTPEEPEPMAREDRELQEIDYPDIDEVVGAPPPPPPDPTPSGPPRFVRGGKITEPKRVSAPRPIYPELARKAGLEGMVILECTIDAAGVVRDVTVLRGAPLGMTEAAVDAVRKWEFDPARMDGRPVDVLYVLTVSFTLNRTG